MNNSRITHIDVAKGIGILLVVFGHLVTFNSYLSNIIYSFHMPLFYILSGVFADTKRKGMEYFKHKFIKLIIPYIVFILIGFAISIAVPTYRIAMINSSISHDLLTAHPDCFQVGATWFVVSLFLVNCIFYFANKFVFSQNNKFGKMATILVPIIFVFISAFVKFTYIYYLKVGTAFMGFVFYTIGFLLRRYFLDTKIHKIEKISFIPAIVLLCFAPMLNVTVGFVNCYYGNLFYFFVFAFCGIFAVFVLSKILCKSRLLKLFGKNSLIILGLHNILFIQPYSWALSHIKGEEVTAQRNMTLIEVFIGLLLSIILFCLLLYIYNNYISKAFNR